MNTEKISPELHTLVKVHALETIIFGIIAAIGGKGKETIIYAITESMKMAKQKAIQREFTEDLFHHVNLIHDEVYATLKRHGITIPHSEE
ncbi:hypothetical protein ID856_14400 [Xenorhabdus sp. 18]|uniref:hypothetical protein n=1 Tax=Xenorhabdus doucetiae TaxID=351671 RepID=UPI001996D232|nr:hypothetical protein [Xenorhabdus sp. 18]MBD2797716.1 hypothetical protein [Xenorhabdus sp. 18]